MINSAALALSKTTTPPYTTYTGSLASNVAVGCLVALVDDVASDYFISATGCLVLVVDGAV